MRSLDFVLIAWALVFVQQAASNPVLPRALSLRYLFHHKPHELTEDEHAEIFASDELPYAPDPLGDMDDFDDYHGAEHAGDGRITLEDEERAEKRALQRDHEAQFLHEHELRRRDMMYGEDDWEPVTPHASHGFDNTIEYLKDLHAERGHLKLMKIKVPGRVAGSPEHKNDFKEAAHHGNVNLHGNIHRNESDAQSETSAAASKLYDKERNSTESARDASSAHEIRDNHDYETRYKLSTDYDHIFDREKSKA